MIKYSKQGFTCGKVHHMYEHLVVPLRIKCCSIYTQRHGPSHHNGMHVLKALCTRGILQGGMATGKGVNTQVFFPKKK